MNFLSKILKIILIDLTLSGDNAVVIGMAAHRLEPSRRRIAIIVGGAAAILLRIGLTAVAAYLLHIRGMEAGGGLLLLWIAIKLLKQEEESHEGIKSAATMKGAIGTILLADFIMSLDNVLAVAAASGDSMGLLLFGLLLSMGILLFVGSLVADLINRLWWLAYVGSAVIAWTGSDMIFKDPLVHTRVSVDGVARYLACSGVVVAVLLVAHLLHRHAEPS
jgi:YjbE family integral membrane protein